MGTMQLLPELGEVLPMEVQPGQVRQHRGLVDGGVLVGHPVGGRVLVLVVPSPVVGGAQHKAGPLGEHHHLVVGVQTPKHGETRRLLEGILGVGDGEVEVHLAAVVVVDGAVLAVQALAGMCSSGDS